MNDNDIAIELKHVTKVYKLYKNDRERLKSVFSKRVKARERRSIDDVSFTIRKGESVALFGRNGAGKSTLLKMINGVAYPTSGDVIVNGRVSALLELKAGFDSEFTGRDNIIFRGQLLGLDINTIRAMEPKIVEFAELGEYIDQPVRTYSSGMKARLGFAINANIDPEILIVDEALSVGDVSFRRKCNEQINELIYGKNVTFLLVTHSTKTATDFCRRGLVMDKGKLVFDGPIEEAAAFYNEMIDKEDRRRRKKRRKRKQQALQKQKALEQQALQEQQDSAQEKAAAVSRPTADAAPVSEAAAKPEPKPEASAAEAAPEAEMKPEGAAVTTPKPKPTPEETAADTVPKSEPMPEGAAQAAPKQAGAEYEKQKVPENI
ncbi:MAG: ATP-binding cassette domain-containing protein [Anaerovoracaceae bacterium]|jgi:teichoic acid transport system ATP-binding protein